MPRLSVALAACLFFVLVCCCCCSRIRAENIEFDVWHRLGPEAKWRPAGVLSGDIDTEALVDAANAALRGGGGRASPPPRASSPVLTLERTENDAFSSEDAKKATERGEGYSIKLLQKVDRSASKKNKNAPRALFTSAPPHCAAAALSGALPLKLDGSLPRHVSSNGGGGGIRVTGVSFDFYGGSCKRSKQQVKQQQQQQQRKQQQRVPLWLPAAAPPLLPPPPPPAAAKKAAAAASLAQQQAEAARRRAAAGGGKDGDEAEAAPPPEDNRTWLQKNWVYALPMFMMAMNIFNGVAGPPPPPPQQQQQQQRRAAVAGGAAAAAVAGAGAAAAAAGAAARSSGGGGDGGGGGGVASLD